MEGNWMGFFHSFLSIHKVKSISTNTGKSRANTIDVDNIKVTWQIPFLSLKLDFSVLLFWLAALGLFQ